MAYEVLFSYCILYSRILLIWVISNSYPDRIYRTPIVKVIASPAYRIPTRREFHLINLSDKAVVDVYLLFPAAIRAFYSFVHHDFLNQGV